MVRPTISRGQHLPLTPSRNPTNTPQWQALATATYVIDMMFIKLSIGIFLLRIAVQNTYRYILWGSLGVVAVWSTVLFFWNVFQCKPVEAQWDYTLEGASCVAVHQIVAAAYALSVMCILSDWLYVGFALVGRGAMGMGLLMGVGAHSDTDALERGHDQADQDHRHRNPRPRRLVCPRFPCH